MACSCNTGQQVLNRLQPFKAIPHSSRNRHSSYTLHKNDALLFNLETPISFTATLSTPSDHHERKKKKKNNNGFSCSSISSEGFEAAGERLTQEAESEEIMSGEWPENFSLLNYDDLRAYLEPELFKEKMKPSALLGEVMSPITRTATADDTLEQIVHHFEFVSGLPVVDENFRCVGVISKKDQERASNGLKSKVAEIMSIPAITLTPEKTVLDAAVLMLKEKFHRIPIVNGEGQVIGIVTRTDIFKALEGVPATDISHSIL